MKKRAIKKLQIAERYSAREKITLFQGNALDFLKQLPTKSISLVVTSPPYNVGKEYETKRATHDYLREQTKIINELIRVLKDCTAPLNFGQVVACF